MMDKELCEKLIPLEEEFDCELFTVSDALEFYEADIKSFKNFIYQFMELAREQISDTEYLKGVIDGFERSIVAVDMVFGGRIEEGF